MPAFRFEALDAAGKTSSGLLEADNAKAARAQLRAQQLVPLQVTPVGAAEGEGSGAGSALKRRAMVSTRNMQPALPADAPAFSMATRPICCRMKTGRSSKAIPSLPASTIRASGLNIAG